MAVFSTMALSRLRRPWPVFGHDAIVVPDLLIFRREAFDFFDGIQSCDPPTSHSVGYPPPSIFLRCFHLGFITEQAAFAIRGVCHVTVALACSNPLKNDASDWGASLRPADDTRPRREFPVSHATRLLTP